MTTWKARRAGHRSRLRTDDNRVPVLCGWHVGVDFCGAPPIAWVVDYEQIVLPGGLTDAGTPGTFRWSRKVLKEAAAGRLRDAARPTSGDYDREGRGPISAEDLRGLWPWTVPCRRGHLNVVDAELLSE